MTHEIETMWMGKMQFNALINGHTVIMDALERAGGEDHGPNPFQSPTDKEKNYWNKNI